MPKTKIALSESDCFFLAKQARRRPYFVLIFFCSASFSIDAPDRLYSLLSDGSASVQQASRADTTRADISISLSGARMLIGPRQLAQLIDVFDAIGVSASQIAMLNRALVRNRIDICSVACVSTFIFSNRHFSHPRPLPFLSRNTITTHRLAIHWRPARAKIPRPPKQHHLPMTIRWYCRFDGILHPHRFGFWRAIRRSTSGP